MPQCFQMLRLKWSIRCFAEVILLSQVVSNVMRYEARKHGVTGLARLAAGISSQLPDLRPTEVEQVVASVQLENVTRMAIGVFCLCCWFLFLSLCCQ